MKQTRLILEATQPRLQLVLPEGAEHLLPGHGWLGGGRGGRLSRGRGCVGDAQVPRMSRSPVLSLTVGIHVFPFPGE